MSNSDHTLIAQQTRLMQYCWVANNQQLARCCQMAQQATVVALDSEFIRVRTLYPALGLIQLYDGITLSLIDPMEISDWQPLRALLEAPQVEKILHAGGEDIWILQHYLGVLPAPLLDTQILAAFIGEPLSSGFSHLVYRYLQVELNKDQQRTNWLARPLNAQQMHYAAADVYYLLPLAAKLMLQAEQANWLDAARDECRLLAQQRTKEVDPLQLYRHIANSWCLAPRSLACLQKLAQWRFAEAIARNLALNFVVKENDLWQIAQSLPSSLQCLQRTGIEQRVVGRYGQQLLAMVAAAQQLTTEVLPPKLTRLIEHVGYKETVVAIRQLTATIAAQSGLNQSLLASQRQIDQLLAWHWRHDHRREENNLPVLLNGWRDALFGCQLLALLATCNN